jgi:hypothetical protein
VTVRGLSNVEAGERDTECRDAPQHICQATFSNQSVSGLDQRVVAKLQRLRQLRLLDEHVRTWNVHSGSRIPGSGSRFPVSRASEIATWLQALFNPDARVDQPGADLAKQLTIGLARITSTGPECGSRVGHRQLVPQRLHFLQIQISGDPTCKQCCPSRDIGCHIRVPIAITADPRPETDGRSL